MDYQILISTFIRCYNHKLTKHLLKKTLLMLVFSVSMLILLVPTNSYAGGLSPITSCTVTPAMVNVQLGPNEDIDIQKTIQCDEPVFGLTQTSDDDCLLNDISLSSFALNNGIIVFNENIQNLGDTSEEHCTATFEIFDENSDTTFWTQEIWINEKQVGGESLSIDTTALLLATTQSPAAWLSSLALVALGIGLFVVSRKSE